MLAFQNFFHVPDVLLVLGVLSGIQADKINFLDLEYFAMVDLPDDCRLGDRYQVPIDLHFHYAVNRLDRGFLIEVGRVGLGDFLAGLIREQTACRGMYISMV